MEAAASAAKVLVASEVTKPSGVELGSVVPFSTMQTAVSRNMVESLAVPTFRVGYTITTDALDALYKKVMHIRPCVLLSLNDWSECYFFLTLLSVLVGDIDFEKVYKLHFLVQT